MYHRLRIGMHRSRKGRQRERERERRRANSVFGTGTIEEMTESLEKSRILVFLFEIIRLRIKIFNRIVSWLLNDGRKEEDLIIKNYHRII